MKITDLYSPNFSDSEKLDVLDNDKALFLATYDAENNQFRESLRKQFLSNLIDRLNDFDYTEEQKRVLQNEMTLDEIYSGFVEALKNQEIVLLQDLTLLTDDDWNEYFNIIAGYEEPSYTAYYSYDELAETAFNYCPSVYMSSDFVGLNKYVNNYDFENNDPHKSEYTVTFEHFNLTLNRATNFISAEFDREAVKAILIQLIKNGKTLVDEYGILTIEDFEDENEDVYDILIANQGREDIQTLTALSPNECWDNLCKYELNNAGIDTDEDWEIKWNQFKHIINKDWGYIFDDEDIYKKMLIELYINTQIHGDKNTTGSRFSVIYLDEFENLTEHFKNIINKLFKNFKLLYRASDEFKKLYQKYKSIFDKSDKPLNWILGEIEHKIENKFDENFNQMTNGLKYKEIDFNYRKFQQELADYMYSNFRIDQLISGEFLTIN